MDRKEAMEFFNTRPRNCLIATADRKGDVNVAVYGSPRMTDENTVVLAVRDSRTYQYLQENPRAVIIVTAPNEVKHDSKAVRVYIERIAVEKEGELLDEFKAAVAARAGKKSADGLKAAVRFKIKEIRPLIAPA